MSLKGSLMNNETIKVNETEQVSETVAFNRTVPTGIEKGDCLSCPYKSNTTSGHCPTYAIYGWCRQTMGENPPDVQEPKSFYKESLRWIDSAPNYSYPIRILKAYLDYTKTKTDPPELGNLMNELQHSRNLLLQKAIEILSRHSDKLREVLNDPLYKDVNLPDALEQKEQIEQIKETLSELDKSLRSSGII